MGGTNVDLRFSPDAVVELDGQEHALSRVSFLAEDPRAYWSHRSSLPWV